MCGWKLSQIFQPRTFSLNHPLSLSETSPPPNFCQLTADTSLCPHNPAIPTGPDPEIRPRCNTYHIHNPISSCTNLTYPITTLEVYETNLQLQSTECNDFYIGETCHSLSYHINGHRFTTTALNSGVPVVIHIQSHKIPFQICWCVIILVTTLSSRGHALTLSGNRSNHSCFYNIA